MGLQSIAPKIAGVSFLKENGKTAVKLDHEFLQRRMDACHSEATCKESCTNNLYVSKVGPSGNKDGPIPSHISLIPGAVGSDGVRCEDLLFLDHIPIVSKDFKYDHDDYVLTWRGAYGGGHIQLIPNGAYGTGSIGPVSALAHVQVEGARLFTCSVSDNAGAKVADGKITFDPSSPEWKNATWDDNRLQLTYISAMGTLEDRVHRFTSTDLRTADDFSFSFSTKENDARRDGWASCSASHQLITTGSEKKYELCYDSSIQVQYSSKVGSNCPARVLGSKMVSHVDEKYRKIQGACTVSCDNSGKNLISFEGTSVDAGVCGYYMIDGGISPFGIFEGKVLIDDQIPFGFECTVKGNELHWKGLPRTLSRATKLPSTGSIYLTSNGTVVESKNGADIKVRRLSSIAAFEAIRSSPGKFDALQAKISAFNFPSPWVETVLDAKSLMQMSSFKKDEDNDYYDACSKKVQEDLHKIMQSYIDPDLWGKLFPDEDQPVLSKELEEVAKTDVTQNGQTYRAAEWYRSLSTAVLVQALKDRDIDFCKKMNGPRAEAYLKQETSTSPVYRKHSELLFELSFPILNPEFPLYANDQKQDVDTKNEQLDIDCEEQIQDIEETILDSNAETKADMIRLAEEARDKAKEENLYWAFQGYKYATDPSQMNQIAALLNAGFSDTTEIFRIMQSRNAVLSAIDPSGWFSQQFVETWGLYLGEVLLMKMLDLSSIEDASVIDKYLREFAKTFQDDPDEKVSEAARGLLEILADEKYSESLEDIVNKMKHLGTMSSMLTFSEIYVFFDLLLFENHAWTLKISDKFGDVLKGACGIGSIALIISGASGFKDMEPHEQALYIIESIQFGGEVFKACLNRGVPYVEFVKGSIMKTHNYRAAASKFFKKGSYKVNGAAAVLEGVGDVGGQYGKHLFDRSTGFSEKAKNSRGFSKVSGKKLTKTQKVLGRNFDDFHGTRLSPVFTVTGAGFSIFSIVNGASGIELGMEILNLIDATLTIVSLVGGWVSKGKAMAAIMSVSRVAGVIAAICGFILMLVGLFKKKPDPYEQFFNDHVKPAGLALSAQFNSVDYLFVYTSNIHGYQLTMTTFEANSKQMRVIEGKSPALGTSDKTPNFGVAVETDGLGFTSVFGRSGTEADGYSDQLSLKATNNSSVQFRSPVVEDEGLETTDITDELWKMAPDGNSVEVEEGKYVLSIGVTVESAKYSGRFVHVDGNGNIVLSPNKTVWKLRMTGIKPESLGYEMNSFDIAVNLRQLRSFQPSFTPHPSQTITFEGRGDLPKGIKFDVADGKFLPTEEIPDTVAEYTYSVTSKNPLGSSSQDVTFRVRDPVKEIFE